MSDEEPQVPAVQEVQPAPATPEDAAPAVAAAAQSGGVRVSSHTEALTIARTFAESGFFKDSRDAAQAAVKIMAGAELGLGPFASMTGIHFVDGKLELAGDTFARMVKQHPRYDYRIIESTKDRCEIAFYERGQEIGRQTWGTDDAKAAGLSGKDNWQKYARAMLFNRCISSGVKLHIPDAVAVQAHTEGEIEFTIDAPEPPKPRTPVSREQLSEWNRLARAAGAGLAAKAGHGDPLAEIPKVQSRATEWAKQNHGSSPGELTGEQFDELLEAVRSWCTEVDVDPATGEVATAQTQPAAQTATEAPEAPQEAAGEQAEGNPPEDTPSPENGAQRSESPDEPAGVTGHERFDELRRILNKHNAPQALLLEAMMTHGASQPADLEDNERWARVQATLVEKVEAQ